MGVARLKIMVGIGSSGVLNLCAPAFEPTVCLGINFFNG